jgi:RimJ/RimL family protein N-acetyltransferase
MTSWLPDDFVAPARLDLPTGHHLRPIRAEDLDLDYAAVMGSQERLWRLFGPVWGWPPPDMTREQDHEDLVRHADEMTRNESFNFACFDVDETALLGCVYLDPPEADGTDAEISWWVVDDQVGTELEAAMLPAIEAWLDDAWPLTRPRIVGRDISWEDWHAEAEEE